jgi:hypothetical protein
MALQVTSGAQPMARRFREAATANDQAGAFQQLQSMGVVDGMVSCLELAEKNRAAFDWLAGVSTAKDKPQFAVRVIKDGFLPKEIYTSPNSDIEYHFARVIILRARDEHKSLTDKLWLKPEDIASKKPFYPEKLRSNADRRKRICAIALAHENFGPGDPRQAALFSLGGLYNFAFAKAGTNPSAGGGKGTTCLLVVRSVLHAAGCNVISPTTSRPTCSCPKGMFGELPTDTFGYIPAVGFDPAKSRPQAGDVFHIRGDDFKWEIMKDGPPKDGKPTKVGTGKFDSGDSSHVGVITDVSSDGKTWYTMEGGTSDHVTRRNERKLVSVQSSHGHWAFENDTKTKVGRRPIQGWWSIDKINAGQWMV